MSSAEISAETSGWAAQEKYTGLMVSDPAPARIQIISPDAGSGLGGADRYGVHASGVLGCCGESPNTLNGDREQDYGFGEVDSSGDICSEEYPAVRRGIDQTGAGGRKEKGLPKNGH